MTIAMPRPAWRPNIAEMEKLLGKSGGYRGMTHREIANSLGVPVEVFSPWFTRMRTVITRRPHALANIRFLIALQASCSRPPCVQPADILRSIDSLERAAQLALAMPNGWPNLPEPNSYLERERHYGGWQDGARPSRGPHERRMQRDDGD